MILRWLILTVAFVILESCSSHKTDHRLVEIAANVSDDPNHAMSRLDSICRDSLAEADRYFYDLLTIKARDKAYVIHTSDSLIRSVIEYYSHDKTNPLYPEALYYGGRVYSDMGDSPNALEFFHRALDFLPAGTEHIAMRRTVLSQTGRLLNSLRLYRDAASYLRETLRLDSILNDTLNEVYNLQLLGGIYLRAENLDSAEFFFNKFLDKCGDLPARHRAKTNIYLAAVRYKRGDIDEALGLIRPANDQVSPIARNLAYAYASKIYLKAGIPDSAYYFAKSLIMLHDISNKKVGYSILLSPEIYKNLPLDTMIRYMAEYQEILESDYNQHESQLALLEHSSYNYGIQRRDKEKAVESYQTLRTWGLIGVIMLLVMVIVVLYLKNRNKSALIELHRSLAEIKSLRHMIAQSKERGGKDNSENDDEDKVVMSCCDDADNDMKQLNIIRGNSVNDMRSYLQNQMLKLYEEGSKNMEVSELILQSDAYLRVQEKIEQGNSIPEDDVLWRDLESVVFEVSPAFKKNLRILTRGNLTVLDYHTSLLIKCGISPSNMSVLLGRSRPTIVSRRDTLCFKIFDKKLGTKVIDGIIRLL